MRSRGRRLLGLLAVPATVALLVVSTSPADAAAPNLVRNPGLETVSGGLPTCFTTYGYGTSTVQTAVRPAAQAHSGRHAVQLTMSGHQTGDAKLMQTQSSSCAPAVVAGRTYTASVWYHGTSPTMALTAFTYSAATGWQYWTELGGPLAQTTDWTQASEATPVVPAGVTAVSFVKLEKTAW